MRCGMRPEGGREHPGPRAPVSPGRVRNRASGTSQGEFWSLAKVTRLGPQLDRGFGILGGNPGLELGVAVEGGWVLAASNRII